MGKTTYIVYRWYVARRDGRQSEPRPCKSAAEANLEARRLLDKPAVPES